MRQILSNPANGTPSKNPATDRIRVMPDLRKIIDNELSILGSPQSSVVVPAGGSSATRIVTLALLGVTAVVLGAAALSLATAPAASRSAAWLVFVLVAGAVVDVAAMALLASRGTRGRRLVARERGDR
jgi:hypothetical protein